MMIPIGSVASSMLSAHPIDMKRNCFVTCSSKSVMIGPTEVPTVLKKSVQSLDGFAEALEDGKLVVFAGAIFFFFFFDDMHIKVVEQKYRTAADLTVTS